MFLDMEAYQVTSPTAPAYSLMTSTADMRSVVTDSVVTVQPGPGIYQCPGVGLKTETWSSSLFACSEDLNICKCLSLNCMCNKCQCLQPHHIFMICLCPPLTGCLGFWCPFCLACQTTSDFGEGLCMPMVDCACCPLACLLSPTLALARCTVSAAALATRTTLRERYNIQVNITQLQV